MIINTEEKATQAIRKIMSRDFDTHDRARKMLVSYWIIESFFENVIKPDIIASELQDNPNSKPDYMNHRKDYSTLLDSGAPPRDRVVMWFCDVHDIDIPDDPQPDDLEFP